MKKKQRLYFILFILASLAAAVGLLLYALQDNIAFFHSPSEVKQMGIAPAHRFRLGGLVKQDSLQKSQETPAVSFIVTDEVDEIRVEYTGILPDLFREGQGVVATGSLDDKGIFVATELLAKHDEKYMPPEVAKSLEKAARGKKE